MASETPTRVELVHTSDPYTSLKPGSQGTVTLVDALGTVHVKWDSGQTLGLIAEVDDWRVLEEAAAAADPPTPPGASKTDAPAPAPSSSRPVEAAASSTASRTAAKPKQTQRGSALPRGVCPECGNDVAVRKGGLIREHHRRQSSGPPAFSAPKGEWVGCSAMATGATKCPGSGKPAKAAA